MLGIGAHKQRLPRPEDALPGRATEMPLRSNAHHVHGRPLRDAFAGLARVQFGMGCFWGAERKFWSLPGVVTTAVGYAGGYTPNPTYREVCSGETGHTEAVLVVFDPSLVSFEALLKVFWESHDPTQGMRQGNDAGSQYRSAIYCEDDAQYQAALASRDAFQLRLSAAGFGAITTEIVHPAPTFYYAEDDHQQYLAKNPAGYCGLGGTGVSCAIGVDA
ncbi:peptide-methionine (S)-S-oxide reductase MsrA [Lysobacter koreensis]|uniref:Peptide methionine sulfoxide reductase MsrA n=1 Tax=Lysobacter koreensis TaxID=266122 RepID=A0ABW2YNH1_9GAMM